MKTSPVPAILAAAFLGAIVAANVATEHLGLVDLGPWTVTAGTFAAGLTFTIRDALHDRTSTKTVLYVIAAGALASGLLVDPALALASGVAFLLAELVDLAIYQPLRARAWTVAVWASALAAAIVDSVLFLDLAPFPLTSSAVAGQVAGKLLATAPAWALWKLVRR